MKKYLLRSALLGLTLLLIAATVQKSRNVLIVGDSISIGYFPVVQNALAPENIIVEHNDGNGGNTKRGIDRIEKWLGTKQWDLILFNFGLHDLCRVTADRKYDVVNGKAEVTLDEYKKNLGAIVDKLKETTATIVFVNTTMVPDSSVGREPKDVALYNAAAAEVMKQYHIKTIDLYTPSLTIHPANSKPKNVHYTPQGYELLAAPLIGAIKENLK